MAHMLLGALLSSSVLAQSEIDFGRLIFESGYLPLTTAAGALPSSAAAGAGVTPVGEAAVTSAGAAVTAGDTAETTVAGVLSSPADSADSGTNPDADIAAYRARILDTQADESPYSSALREQYDALGTLLQRTGAHTDAIEAFASAMQIDRVNGGLFTLEQIPLVQKIIASHSNLGNFDEVNDLHEYLFYIQQRTFAEDDPRLLAAKEEWADWNVEAYLKEGIKQPGTSISINDSRPNRTEYVAIQNRDGTYNYVPRDRMLNVLNPNGAATNATDYMLRSSMYAVSPELVIDERLRRARDLYEELLEAGDPEAASIDTDAFRVAHKLANIAYAAKKQIDGLEAITDEGSLHYNRLLQPQIAPQVVTRGYRESRETLEDIAEKLEQDPDATLMQKAMAYIHLADWHVGFDSGQQGQEAYRKAWELLRDAGMDETAITAVFMPRPLIPAPVFAIHEYSRALYGIDPDAPLEYRGFIDLTLNINRYGDVRGINIDATSPDTPEILRRTLLDFLRGQKMRPAVVNGATVAREDLSLRYYYTY